MSKKLTKDEMLALEWLSLNQQRIEHQRKVDEFKAKQDALKAAFYDRFGKAPEKDGASQIDEINRGKNFRVEQEVSYIKPKPYYRFTFKIVRKEDDKDE